MHVYSSAGAAPRSRDVLFASCDAAWWGLKAKGGLGGHLEVVIASGVADALAQVGVFGHELGVFCLELGNFGLHAPILGNIIALPCNNIIILCSIIVILCNNIAILCNVILTLCNILVIGTCAGSASPARQA